MDLIELLEIRRWQANGKPLSYRKFAKDLDIHFVTLYRFMKGRNKLNLENVRTIATKAKKNDDRQMLFALAEYALGVNIY